MCVSGRKADPAHVRGEGVVRDTNLALSPTGFGSHMGQEGDVVHLDESLIDLGFVGEDVQTGRVELQGGSNGVDKNRKTRPSGCALEG